MDFLDFTHGISLTGGNMEMPVSLEIETENWACDFHKNTAGRKIGDDFKSL